MEVKPPTQERLQEIRDADATIGDLESLRWYTPIYTQRRELLLYIDMLVSDRQDDALAVAALSDMLQPYSGGTSDLHDIVARMRRAQEIYTAVIKQPPGPIEPGACCANESRTIDGGCSSCGAPCL